MAKAISTHPMLVNLSLSDNSLQNDAIKAIAAAIKRYYNYMVLTTESNTSMLSVDLNSTKISQEGGDICTIFFLPFQDLHCPRL